MNWRGIGELMMFAVIVALALLCIHFCNRPADTIIQKEIVHDTTTVIGKITLFPLSPTRWIHHHDTTIIYRDRESGDSSEVTVPVVQAEYKDSSYEAVVSGGYFAKLDRITVFPQETVIHTTEKSTVVRRPKISVVLGFGVSVDCKGQVSPTVNATIGFPVWTYYGKGKENR